MRWKQRVFTKCPKKVCVLNSAVEVAGEAQTIIADFLPVAYFKKWYPKGTQEHPWIIHGFKC